jgi:glycosyltransferase involved in cell wall biosynthesis
MDYSIVIPLYNKRGQIRRAIDSVLGQSIKDFELIVVDDGSTDGGGDVVREVRDPRLRLVSQPNAGVSVARNRGAAEATSDVVAFLDADDAWDPDFLETIASLRCQFPDAAVWGTAYRFLRRSGVEESPRYHGALPAGDAGGLIDYFAGNRGNSPLVASSVAIRKDALAQVGGFPVGLAYSEDHDTWLRLALRFPVAWSPRPKVLIHEDAENRTDGFMYLGNYPFFESARRFLAESDSRALRAEVYDYLAWRHTELLASKWLNGERDVLREIVRDCRHIPGYFWKCAGWYLLSWVPYPLVKLIWTAKRRLSGRGAGFPEAREIRPLGGPPGAPS